MERSTSEDTQSQGSCTISSDTISSGTRSVGGKTLREEVRETMGEENLPSLYIGTPHPFPYISTGFCHSLRNLFLPFPDHKWEPVSARFIPDARNAIVEAAVRNEFDLLMMIDADQYFGWDFFLELWEGLQQHGPDAIVTGWSICKTGMFANRPSLFKFGQADGGVDAFTEAEIQTAGRYFEVDGFGSCGLLGYTSTFRKLKPPVYADLNLINDEPPVDGMFAATTFTVGQDVLTSARFRAAGVKLIAARDARMPHEIVKSI